MQRKHIAVLILCFIAIKRVKMKVLNMSHKNFFEEKLHNRSTSSNCVFSIECQEQMDYFEKGLLNFDMWALKMADATSKLQSGLLVGNFHNLGNFDECISVKENRNGKELNGKYCLGSVNITMSTRAQKLGLKLISNRMAELTDDFDMTLKWAACAPEACTAEEIAEYFSGFTEQVSFNFTENQCQSKTAIPELGIGTYVTITCFAIIFLFLILSTCYDIYLQKYEKKASHVVLIAFSALTNGKKLLKTTPNSNQLLCLNGLKSISMMWVIIGHSYEIVLRGPVVNFLDVYDWSQANINMFILGGSVSVDTFFLIGGLLTAYTFMGAVKKGIKFNISMYYVHRYIRLTPALAAAIFAHAFLLEHIGSGPVYPNIMNENLVEFCKTDWWTTLLYIQNYFSSLTMCVPQSWYLAVDMQLFILSPLFLIPLKKYPKSTLIGLVVITISSIIWTFVIAWHFKLSQLLFGRNPEEQHDDESYYYVSTHTRMSPYIIGVILGYFIFKAKHDSMILVRKKLFMLLLWLFSLGILCTCVFASQNVVVGEYNRIEQSMAITFIRPAWSIGLCWIIYACVLGNGGPINSFLSLPIFQVLGKLTYSLYLVHYAIIMTKYASTREPVRFSNIEQMYSFWGNFVISSAVAVIWTLMFESPMIIIEKIIFGGDT